MSVFSHVRWRMVRELLIIAIAIFEIGLSACSSQLSTDDASKVRRKVSRQFEFFLREGREFEEFAERIAELKDLIAEGRLAEADREKAEQLLQEIQQHPRYVFETKEPDYLQHLGQLTNVDELEKHIRTAEELKGKLGKVLIVDMNFPPSYAVMGGGWQYVDRKKTGPAVPEDGMINMLGEQLAVNEAELTTLILISWQWTDQRMLNPNYAPRIPGRPDLEPVLYAFECDLTFIDHPSRSIVHEKAFRAADGTAIRIGESSGTATGKIYDRIRQYVAKLIPEQRRQE